MLDCVSLVPFSVPRSRIWEGSAQSYPCLCMCWAPCLQSIAFSRAGEMANPQKTRVGYFGWFKSSRFLSSMGDIPSAR